ncbi:MAG: class I SAM-dependent methyltransferase [Chlorobiaceae bacterium]|nr:class I SAM-dependent methyltransferase [Chlorobiaceae bacterium]
MSDRKWTDKQRFDSKASEWDANAVRAALADAVARAIIAHLPVNRPENGLEFGCGTGLVTLRVSPLLDRLTAVDTSDGMLVVLNEKISAAGVPNVATRLLDLSLSGTASQLEGPFDFVFSSMTLHHIPDTEGFLSLLHGLMAPGGTLAIADLDAEDGLFHEDASEKVHHGFVRQRLKEQLEQAGFGFVSFITAHVVEKKTREGQISSYPVFLVTAVKPQH